MKKLYKAIGVGIVGLSLIFGGCEKKKSTPNQQYIKLQGTVLTENYVPRNTGSFIDPVISSKYSFSVDTKFGKKAIQIQSTRQISKETIDSLVDPETKVEIVIREDETIYKPFLLKVSQNNSKIKPQLRI